jgi:Asp-tRNA(Asn)/Glu-tRNA(Gln) amidotransferase A subunit family amidase
MSKNGIDAWINPSTISDAPAGITSTGSPIMNLPWTYSGLPTITIPAGKSKRNLPMGLHISCRFNNDEQLLDIAEQIAEDISS